MMWIGGERKRKRKNVDLQRKDKSKLQKGEIMSNEILEKSCKYTRSERKRRRNRDFEEENGNNQSINQNNIEKRISYTKRGCGGGGGGGGGGGKERK